jgi:hypothetical protein
MHGTRTIEKGRKNMAVNQKKTAPLRPLPMRVTPKQFERLHQARERDLISVQEHVRRALDAYLDMLDRKAARERELEETLPPPVRTDAVPSTPARSRLSSARTRVVYR